MALLEKVHTSLEELESLVEKTDDPLEREGLKAFIDCVTPHLVKTRRLPSWGKSLK
ncbi:hypothetical protein [Melghirimyces algeriensis]|uniref:Uncharacterized protein n=1 Tax=Melghirimyces algeriensis TaxID=910412 RepID=A0A521CH04_9BACL|nr:hypothetical protein [Melghirimyces algeriensis]SMO58000.1 hypothetical protein SAMN06264849_103327 [Melghirimyces algeriensis]